MPRFVMLFHEMPVSTSKTTHWDLMFESGDTLLTWSLPESPRPNLTIEATALPDHRIAYLDYEGPVSGDRGHVTRWDAGSYEWICNSEETYQADVSGTRLDGRIQLVRLPGGKNTWSFRFAPRGETGPCAYAK